MATVVVIGLTNFCHAKDISNDEIAITTFAITFKFISLSKK